MIKIVVEAKDLNTKKKISRSFQSKKNRQIQLKELDKLMVFAHTSIKNGYQVSYKYKITYDDFGIIKALGGNSMPMNFSNKVVQQLQSAVNTINANCKHQ